MNDQGFEGSLYAAIRRDFAGRATLKFAEVCKLLKIHNKTLLRHIRTGTIGFRETGLGRLRVRREFALEDVLAFYENAFRKAEPTVAGQKGAVRTRSSGNDFLVERAKRKGRPSVVRKGTT
jgi:excisionase family DNA binding protein